MAALSGGRHSSESGPGGEAGVAARWVGGCGGQTCIAYRWVGQVCWWAGSCT